MLSMLLSCISILIKRCIYVVIRVKMNHTYFLQKSSLHSPTLTIHIHIDLVSHSTRSRSLPCNLVMQCFVNAVASPSWQWKKRTRMHICAHASVERSAKQRLLRILPSFINLQSQSDKVLQLIQQLEKEAPLPATSAFTQLAVQGEWRLLFSSARTVPSRGQIRVRGITQTIAITPDPVLINTVKWSLNTRQHVVNAVLRVLCSYQFVGPARMMVKLEDHQIRFVDNQDGVKSMTREALKDLVTDLQRTLPIELFDPSGLIDVTCVQPDFRIARFVGKRLAGVRNVFVSTSVPLHLPANHDEHD